MWVIYDRFHYSREIECLQKRQAWNCEQNTPHHIYNVGEHTEKVVDYCIEKGGSELLIKAAWLHDAGKIEAKYFDGKYDRFTGHPEISVNIASELIEPLYVIELIRYHDAHRYTECNFRKLAKYGRKWCEELKLLMEADLIAQNPNYKCEEKKKGRAEFCEKLFSELDIYEKTIIDKVDKYYGKDLVKSIIDTDINSAAQTFANDFKQDVVVAVLAYFESILCGDWLQIYENLRDDFVCYLLMYSIENENVEVVDFLMNNFSYDTLDPFEFTTESGASPLYLAIFGCRDENIIKKILRWKSRDKDLGREGTLIETGFYDADGIEEYTYWKNLLNCFDESDRKDSKRIEYAKMYLDLEMESKGVFVSDDEFQIWIDQGNESFLKYLSHKTGIPLNDLVSDFGDCE